MPQHILRRAHHHQHGSARPNAEHGQRRAAGQRQRHRRVHRAGHVVRPARAEKLRNNDRRAGRQADEKADQQIDQRARRAADRRQRLFADKLADDNGVRRVIELLEKRAQHNREKEQQELFPDNALSHGVLQVLLFLGHTHSSIIAIHNPFIIHACAGSFARLCSICSRPTVGLFCNQVFDSPHRAGRQVRDALCRPFRRARAAEQLHHPFAFKAM